MRHLFQAAPVTQEGLSQIGRLAEGQTRLLRMRRLGQLKCLLSPNPLLIELSNVLKPLNPFCQNP